MLCANCQKPLMDHQWANGTDLKSCPKCSELDGKQHVFYRYPQAFGTTDVGGRRYDTGTMAEARLFQADAVEWLRSLEAESVDLVVTDPAYESLEKHRARGTTTRLRHSKASSNDWFAVFPNRRFPELFAQLYRVLRRDRHAYVFCDAETLFELKPAGEAAGFKFWKPLVWDKRRIGMGYHYRARYELILFFEKGRRRLRDLSVPDVLEAPRMVNGYPTEKPAILAATLIRQSAHRGELVIDPFMGSGAFGEAALEAGCRFLGADISETAMSVARARLSRALQHVKPIARSGTRRC